MMKRRVQRPSWFQRHKKYIYMGGGALSLIVLSFTVTLLTANKRFDNEKLSQSPININEYAYKTDESSLRINPESLKRSEAETEPETKMKDEPQEAVVSTDIKEEQVVVSKATEEKTIEVSVTPVKKEITFIKPIDGEIILEYAKDKLVYSETLEEWITHNGVDIKGDEAMPVKASADGKVKDKKVDPRYGNTIIIEHEDGYKSIYSNLSTLDLVEVGQEVKQGDIISGVGSGYGFEIDEGAHIHWEIIKENSHISPMKFSD